MNAMCNSFATWLRFLCRVAGAEEEAELNAVVAEVMVAVQRILHFLESFPPWRS
jgi:hypothetical protein